MSKDYIAQAVSRLEKDAILPYLDLQPTLGIICKTKEKREDGDSSYLSSLVATASKYQAKTRILEADTPLEVINCIQKMKSNSNIFGIIIISDYGEITRTLYNMIPARLDIDGLSAISIGTTIGNTSPIAYRSAPCTAVACMKIMEEINEQPNFSQQTCLIIGRSMRVGRPLAEILTQKNMTVTLAHSESASYVFHPQTWNYIVSAIGKPNYWNEENPLYFASHTDNHFIDVGMSCDETGKLCGDIDRDWFYDKANSQSIYLQSYITPVIGGVGKVTTTVVFAKLFNNASDFFKDAHGLYLKNINEEPNYGVSL